MIDQLIIGDKASFDDFEASLASRKIKKPAKKSIKETVPFSNVTYDFSAINGEVYWEERELEYVFEIMADDPEQLEEKKRKFAAWVMGVMERDIHDPFIPDYHFKGTYDDMEEEDDEGLDKSTVTVTFTAYPYMIANLPKRYRVEVPLVEWVKVTLLNEGAHKVTPTLKADGPIELKHDGGTVSWNGGDDLELVLDSLALPVGVTEIELATWSALGVTVEISFNEEVM